MKPVYKAVIWMFAGMFSFSFMAVAGRELSTDLNTAQILLYRSLIGLLIIAFVLQVRGWSYIRTSIYPSHIIRNTAHYAGQYGWFLGLAYLPLAEVFAIEFTVPVWTAIAATLILKEHMSVARIQAIAMGIIGMLIILRPGLGLIHPAALAVLFGAMAYGISHAMTRRISSFDDPLGIIFYMTVVQIPIGLIMTGAELSLLSDARQWFWIMVVSITALTGHYCLSSAMKYADATVVIPMDFLRLPLIAVVGFFAYQESVSLYVFIGALLMMLGNWINIRAENKSKLISS